MNTTGAADVGVREKYRIDPRRVTAEGQTEKSLDEKYQDLQDYLKSLGRVAVAFSGGVDSTLLLKVAHDVLGDNCVAVTAKSKSFPERELNESNDFCLEEGIKHYYMDSEELDLPGFRQNPTNRCYLCKHELFEKIQKIAEQEKITAIVEGSNLEDNGDYRPGLQAVAELGIKSPLRQIGFTKNDIRTLSRYLELPTWDKQSFACLSSRFVYGETISKEKLGMVDRAEQLLLDLGFHQVRVRIHDTMARIEVLPEEFVKLIAEDTRAKIITSFREYGFTYISMDLIGYRTGSMNEVIDK